MATLVAIMQILRSVIRQFLWPVKALATRVALATSDKVHVCGFEIANLSTSGMRECVQPIRAALLLIEGTDAVLFRRIQRLVHRVIVADGDVGYFSSDMRGPVIGTGYLRRCSAEQLAFVVIHEATHARIWSRGIRTTKARRARIERICIDAEIAFAQKLPRSDDLIAEIRDKSKSSWWTAEIQSDRLASVVSSNGDKPTWTSRVVRKLPHWLGLGDS